jgi:hypothetical protein
MLKMANSDLESMYSVRRKSDGRWCVLQTQADGSKREICDFVTDSEARDWIVGKTGSLRDTNGMSAKG